MECPSCRTDTPSETGECRGCGALFEATILGELILGQHGYDREDVGCPYRAMAAARVRAAGVCECRVDDRKTHAHDGRCHRGQGSFIDGWDSPGPRVLLQSRPKGGNHESTRPGDWQILCQVCDPERDRRGRPKTRKGEGAKRGGPSPAGDDG